MSLWDGTSHISSIFICSVLYRTVSYHVFSYLTFSYQNSSTISCISINYQSTILCSMHFLSDISLHCISIRMLLESNNVCCAVILEYLSKDYFRNIYRYPQLSINVKRVQQKAFAPFHFSALKSCSLRKSSTHIDIKRISVCWYCSSTDLFFVLAHDDSNHW